MAPPHFNQRQLNGGAAALLVIAGLLFVLTETLAPAVIGLVLTIVAGVLVFIGRRRRDADQP
jgi:hypothetical protein